MQRRNWTRVLWVRNGVGAAFVLCCSICLLLSCSRKPERIPVRQVTLDQNKISLTEGDTYTLTASVLPDNASNKTILWTSSNPDVATIDGGVITAVGKGSTLIFARAEEDDRKASCSVTVYPLVKDIAVEGVSLNHTSLRLARGSQYDGLEAVVSPPDATNKQVSWRSSNYSVASVLNTGFIYAKSVGTAVIEVSTQDGDKKASCEVTVFVPVASLTLEPKSVTLNLGESVPLNLTISPEDATACDINWWMSAPSVASLKDGILTATKRGETIIRATAESGATAECRVTVIDPEHNKDGSTVVIQNHTEGKGIKILIVGDGFMRRDLDNGRYDVCMKKAAEYFFSIEPYKSFRNRFDVVNMRVESETDVFNSAKKTAFESVYEGSRISGNLSTAYEKARNAFGTVLNVLIIIVMNSPKYGGTCYMSVNSTSVAFCPMSEEYYDFEFVVHHEAGGHGFANLGDEYFSGGTVTSKARQEISYYYTVYGWYPNIDITSDRNTIRWAQFLSDYRYISSVGIYEGGYDYKYGVWRPTMNSCMNRYGDFNAPSRYAIYKRIMIRSGDSWSWEDFVSYDAKNRTSSTARTEGCPKRTPEIVPPHASPVAVNIEDWLPAGTR